MQLEGATLCLDANSGGGVELAPCGAASTAWGMAADEQVHVGRAGATQTCLQAPPSAAGAGTAPAMKRCIYTGPIPPVSVAAPNFGTQAYVWGPTTAQVVAASSSECLTAGAANLDPGAKGGWVTNNGTLEHEVWMGDLTPLNGAPRRVVALFNKGGSHGASETLAAPASLYTRGVAQPSAARVTVRDVVNHANVPLGAAGAIEASVASHGVALFVVTFGPAADPVGSA